MVLKSYFSFKKGHRITNNSQQQSTSSKKLSLTIEQYTFELKTLGFHITITRFVSFQFFFRLLWYQILMLLSVCNAFKPFYYCILLTNSCCVVALAVISQSYTSKYIHRLFIGNENIFTTPCINDNAIRFLCRWP